MKKLFTAFLVIVMLIGVLASCNGKNQTLDGGTSDIETTDAEESTVDTSEETEKATEQTTAEKIVLGDGVLFENRKTGHTIIYAIGSSVYSDKIVAQNAVIALQNALDKNCNIEMNAVGENNYYSQNPDMSGNKVVVGYISKDPVAVELYNSLVTVNSYVIKFVGNSLYIIGGSGAATAVAVDYFIDKYLIKYLTPVLTLEEGIIVENNEPPALEELTIAGTPVENYVIVHDDTAVGAKRAKELKALFIAKTGFSLDVCSQKDSTAEHEILVGKTDRQESKDIRATYARPNVYYTVKVVGKKLVCMGEGWNTLGKINTALDEYFDTLDPESCNLTGEVLSGDMIDEIDTTDMLNRAEGTDVRVFNYNTYGTKYDYGTYSLFSGETERGETIGDIILAYYPDVITTNEFYVNSALYKAAMTQLSDYYQLIDTSEYDSGYPYPNITGNIGRGNPEQILIKKSCNFTIVDSGWRYLGETDGSIADYHGIHWAVLKTQAGEKFIITVGHYGDANTYIGYAQEHQAAVQMAQQMSGSTETLPTVVAGDLFSSALSGAGYKYHVNTCGFTDPQRIKEINRNITEKGDININHATSHPFGKGRGDGTRIDFILHNSAFTPLKFKVLKSEELNYTSDHYPEVVDLKFT